MLLCLLSEAAVSRLYLPAQNSGETTPGFQVIQTALQYSVVWEQPDLHNSWFNRLLVYDLGQVFSPFWLSVSTSEQ